MEIFHRHHRGEATLDPNHATFTMPFSKILGHKEERMHFHRPGAQRSRKVPLSINSSLSPPATFPFLTQNQDDISPLIAQQPPKKQPPTHRPTHRHRHADEPGGDTPRLGPVLLVHRLAFLA